MNNKVSPKAIIGLGNPGKQYYNNRHNIGFRIVDAFAEKYGGSWKEKDVVELAEITVNGHKVLLVKPQTFMNASGKVIPILGKQGIKPNEIVVIHDELEQPFGKIKLRFGGSARGHKGLRSIMDICGKDFHRLFFGIGRPENQKDVAQYVLQDFTEDPAEVERLIKQAVTMLESYYI